MVIVVSVTHLVDPLVSSNFLEEKNSLLHKYLIDNDDAIFFIMQFRASSGFIKQRYNCINIFDL